MAFVVLEYLEIMLCSSSLAFFVLSSLLGLQVLVGVTLIRYVDLVHQSIRPGCRLRGKLRYPNSRICILHVEKYRN